MLFLLLAIGATARAAAPGASPPPNLLLITLDTTRADRLGCYGYRPGLTPALDALARRGTLFEQAYSNCPMTLPAHATMLTGLEPPEHGLRINGKNSLGGGPITLAELLAGRGYRTGAFIAAFVLNGRFGLGRGFETYDDDLSGALKQEVPNPITVYRPGNLVTERALTWLGKAVEAAEPFFCWIHLYDPHYPDHAHPELADTRFAGVVSYDAEIAFMDRQVGRLAAFLDQHTLSERTLVVAVGDHGEGLEDHGDPEHGYLLNEEVLHVPLIMALPGRVRAGQRVTAVVSLVDLFPTLLDVLGLGVESRGLGRSLGPALYGATIPSAPSYAESDLPYMHFGWSALRSLTTPGWKYIRTTEPELYDRATDRQELRNLARDRPEQTAELERSLAEREAQMTVRSAPPVTLDAADRRRLEALGYVGGASEPARAAGPLKDIKSMLPVKHLETNLARGIALGTLSESQRLAMARELVKRSPETPSFQNSLGSALTIAGDLDEAIVHLSEAVRLRPDFAEAHNNLGNALARQGKLDEAMEHHTQAVRLNPELSEAQLSMGNTLAAKGAHADALKHYREALRLKPDYAEAHVNMGNTLARLHDPERAMHHYREALRLKPNFALPHHNLATLLAERGQVAQAIGHYQKAVRLDPSLVAARHQFAKLLAEEGKHAAAIAQYSEAMRLKPDDPDIADDLAAAYAAAGQPGNAVRTGRKAMELARSAGQEALAKDIERRIEIYERMLKVPAATRR